MAWEDLIAQNNAASSPQTQATTDLLRQQTIGAMQTNRVQALQLQYQQALGGAIGAAAASQPGSGGGGQQGAGVFGNAPMTLDPRLDDPANAASTPGAESSGVANGADGAGAGHKIDTAGAIARTQQAYQPVLPNSYTPAEIQALQMATLSGNDAAVKFIQSQHTMKVDSANAAIQQRAQQEYNGVYGVVSAPEGRALDALSLVEPGNAARLQADGATDAEVRQWATQFLPIVHRAARLPVEYGTDGVARDATTKEAIPGFDDYVGMSAQQRADLAKQSTEPVDTFVNGVPAKQARWKVEGADSAKDWLGQHVDLAEALRHGTGPAAPQVGSLVSGAAALPPGTQPNATGPGPNPPGGGASSIPWLRPQQNGQVPQQQGAQQPSRAIPPPQGSPQPTPAPQSSTPTLQDWQTKAADPKVYADPDFKLKAPSIPAGQAMPPAQIDEQKAIAKSKTDLLQEQNDNSKAAGQALRYYSLASDVLNSGGVTTGWSQQHLNSAAAALNQMGIPSSWLGDPSKAAELTKALTQAGLQNLKTTYGSKVTQNEVFLNLEHANPNADMQLPALRRLINDQTQNLMYDSAGALRANRYIAAGNDPRQFDTWQQKYFPRQRDAVTPQSGDNTSNAAPVRVIGAADYAKVPTGSRYITPDGKTRVKQ